MISQVILGRKIKQELAILPQHILLKFRGWIVSVELVGLRETRLIKSYHDEPLLGNRKGQGSIRLNKAYRAIYVELTDNEI